MQSKRNRRQPYGSHPPKITPLPSKRFRVQCWDPVDEAYVSAPAVLGLKERSFRTRTEAVQVARAADEQLGRRTVGGSVTVATLAQRWEAHKRANVDDDGWRKESSAVVMLQRIRPFVTAYGGLPVSEIEEEHWTALGGPLASLAAVKSMFSWAVSARGGRLIERNPFMDLRSSKAKATQKNPPTEAEVDQMIAHAYDLLPTFGAWLEFACFTGMRPGEIDGLRWVDVVDAIDDDGPFKKVLIRQQFSRTSAAFTLPKSNVTRELEIDIDSRAAHALARAAEFSDGVHVFVNTRGRHFTGDSRLHYWRTVYDRMGWARKQYTPYLCTRHFAGWYLVNVAELESEDVAFQLGHNDNGELVRKLYGHRDRTRALRRVRRAYRAQRRAA